MGWSIMTLEKSPFVQVRSTAPPVTSSPTARGPCALLPTYAVRAQHGPPFSNLLERFTGSFIRRRELCHLRLTCDGRRFRRMFGRTARQDPLALPS